MPTRNTIKFFDAPAYYHIYNRGVGDEPIYHDDQDRQKFMDILRRHLDPKDEARQADGSLYKVYQVKLVAYCLMGNHFHLLLCQEEDPQAISQLMRSVGTAYTMYFNRRYKKHGHLFQSVFKASRISHEEYLLHITRYIHMNPRSYLRYKWSSLSHYLGEPSPSWLHADQVNDMSPKQYKTFLSEYESKKAEIKLLKSLLAN